MRCVNFPCVRNDRARFAFEPRQHRKQEAGDEKPQCQYGRGAGQQVGRAARGALDGQAAAQRLQLGCHPLGEQIALRAAGGYRFVQRPLRPLLGGLHLKVRDRLVEFRKLNELATDVEALTGALRPPDADAHVVPCKLVGAVPVERYRLLIDWVLAGEPGGVIPLAADSGSTAAGQSVVEPREISRK